MTDGPFLWYLNRSTGFVILVLFTLSVALGILATGGKAGKRVPSFVTQSLHRNIALLSVVMLVVHIVTAVVDSFVDIRWWQAVIPWWGSTYMPLWLGLGTLAFDLFAVITITSMLRTHMQYRSWWLIHLLSYVGWVLSVVHGIGIGTDVKAGTSWAFAIVGGCVVVVIAAVVLRLAKAGSNPDLAGVSAR